MFDALDQAWRGQRRSERWAATVGSVAIHGLLIGLALLPRSAKAPVTQRHIEVQLPPYVRVAGSPALRVVMPDALAISTVVPDLPDLQVPIEAMPNVYASPTPWSLLQSLWQTRGGTSETPGPGPMIESALDDPPEVLTTPAVRYPPLLREAGIEGSVVLEFVVDTIGHSEPATIRIISSTNKLFEEPAREAIMKSVYRAGRWRGSPVRALSLERVTFTITK